MVKALPKALKKNLKEKKMKNTLKDVPKELLEKDLTEEKKKNTPKDVPTELQNKNMTEKKKKKKKKLVSKDATLTTAKKEQTVNEATEKESSKKRKAKKRKLQDVDKEANKNTLITEKKGQTVNEAKENESSKKPKAKKRKLQDADKEDIQEINKDDDTGEKKREVLTISTKDCRKVIGKKGSVIKSIRQESKAEVILNKSGEDIVSTVTIIGTKKSVKKAKVLIIKCFDKVNDDDSVELKTDNIEQSSPVKTNKKRRSRKKSVGSGDRVVSDVVKGKENLQTNSQQRKKQENVVPSDSDKSIRMTVPSASVSCIIGKKGSVIKNIRKESGADVRIESNRTEDTEKTACTIKGAEESIAKAKAMIGECIKKRGETVKMAKTGQKNLNGEDEAVSAKIKTKKRKLQDVDEEADKEKAPLKSGRTDRITEEFSIEKNQVGKVIGKGGQTISDIRMTSGAHITVKESESEGVCTITGSKGSVRSARDLIESLLEDSTQTPLKSGRTDRITEEFSIEKNQVGKVIGKGGQTISDIRMTSGAHITVKESESEGVCTITGSEGSVRSARDLIESLLGDSTQAPLESGRTDRITEEFSIGKSQVGKVIGKGGQTISDIRMTSGAHITVKESESEGVCTITGSKGSVRSARDLIESLLEDSTQAPLKSGRTDRITEEFSIGKSQVGKVIGKGGQTISDIRLTSGAHITVKESESEGVCTITGSEGSVRSARDLIESLLEDSTQAPLESGRKDRITEEFSIGKSQVGKVIGKGGQTISDIRLTSGAHITVKESESEGVCTITGSEGSVRSARDLIESLLGDSTQPDPQSERITEEFSLTQKDHVGKIIGRGGKTIARIRAKTGAYIVIKKSETEEDHDICVIKGTKESVRRAKRRIDVILTDKKEQEKSGAMEEGGDEDEEEEDGEGRIIKAIDESDISDMDTDDEEELDGNVEVTILVSSAQTLLDNKQFKKLQTEAGAKIVMDSEEGEEDESFCRISGEEKAVMETKEKVEKLLKKMEKKVKKAKPTLQIDSSLTWDTDFRLPKTNNTGDSSSDDSDVEETQKPVKKTKGEKRQEKLEEEKQLYEYERKKLEGEIIPETADDFDRLVVNSPDSSVVWLRYMAFHLETSEFDKARSVAERALKTISFREEGEKLNIWVAYMNLENMYGTNESLGKILARAIVQCEPLDVYLPLVNIYVDSSKIEEAERLYSVMTKKYSSNKMVWTNFADFYFQQHRPESARKLLQRALKSVENRHHVETITKFAQMEFKYGEPDRGKTMFENVLNTYPKRTDVWSVYVDLLTKLKDHEVTRVVYKRMIGLKLAAKKIKFFFKKYLEFEEKFGTEAQIAEVKQKALQYVESGGTID